MEKAPTDFSSFGKKKSIPKTKETKKKEERQIPDKEQGGKIKAIVKSHFELLDCFSTI